MDDHGITAQDSQGKLLRGHQVLLFLQQLAWV